MAGFYHTFLLVSRHEFEHQDYLNLINNPDAILIHDDIIRYIFDTLLWIPCHVPSKKKLVPYNGLNLYGPTIIKSDGASVAQEIIKCWITLFKFGPEILKLTGSFIVEPGQSSEEGYHKKLIINREKLIEKLNTIIQYCHQVLENNDERYILHLGI